MEPYLSLHKLSRDLSKDEIGACATKYARMVTGTIPDMVEELYFCVYKNKDLLSIAINRPSFTRSDRDAAITILTHSKHRYLNPNAVGILNFKW